MVYKIALLFLINY